MRINPKPKTEETVMIGARIPKRLKTLVKLKLGTTTTESDLIKQLLEYWVKN